MNKIDKLRARAVAFARNEDGVAMTEYLLLLGAIAGAGALFLTFFGTTIGNVLTSTCTAVFSAAACGVTP